MGRGLSRVRTATRILLASKHVARRGGPLPRHISTGGLTERPFSVLALLATHTLATYTLATRLGTESELWKIRWGGFRLGLKGCSLGFR